MTSTWLPTTRDIREAVWEELSPLGGTIADCCDDGRRLFLRSVLPAAREVSRGDRVQGGVAVMAVDEEIRVHPYTFRQVCRNGAIMASVLQTRSVRRREDDAPEEVAEVEFELREAVRACAGEDAFSASLKQMRSAKERQADLVMQLLPLLARISPRRAGEYLAGIVGRMDAEGDHSGFGLMNAVTSLARDQSDPRTRWRLEELGGSIPALVRRGPRIGGHARVPAGSR